MRNVLLGLVLGIVLGALVTTAINGFESPSRSTYELKKYCNLIDDDGTLIVVVYKRNNDMYKHIGILAEYYNDVVVEYVEYK